MFCYDILNMCKQHLHYFNLLSEYIYTEMLHHYKYAGPVSISA